MLLSRKELNKVNTCIQCGTCVASCYSSRATALNTRRLVFDYINKNIPMHDDTIWYCSTCYSCQERCPRGIMLTDILIRVREEVAEEHLPSKLKKFIENIREYGMGVPPRKSDIDMRRKLGLKNYSAQFIEKSLKEVREIIDSRRDKL